jgi:amino acid transporter
MGLVLLGIIAAGLLGMMFYFFLSKKSSNGLKLLALAALVISGVAMAVCGFFIVFGARAVEEEGSLEQIIMNERPVPVEKTSITGLILFLVVMIIFFGVVIFLGVKDRKKKAVDAAIAGVKDSDLERL